jgi:hypothetical protein
MGAPYIYDISRLRVKQNNYVNGSLINFTKTRSFLNNYERIIY